MASTSGDQNDVQHKIFLSHSGTEKDFVEQLFQDLDNIYPGRVFFDKDSGSLPPGENFPKHILYASKNFEVAVIVISEDYFKRKWPMIELATFVKSQSQFPEMKILPLFYRLTVDELKQKWRKGGWSNDWVAFKNEKESRISDETLDSWKAAVRHIFPFNGIQMIQGEAEVSYRKRIVQALCEMVPPVTEFDVSHVEGKDRICTFFRERLEPFDANRPVRFYGMYGMGGMGKTTISRVLCNEFSSEFMAKVCHVELNNNRLVDLLKKLLRTLSKWNEIDMSKFTDEFEVRALLQRHVPKHRLFLVVDNVWDQENSIQEAQSFLSLRFKEGSVVLVTARSEEILNNFNNMKECFSTPFLDTCAATKMFLNSAGYKSLAELEPKNRALTKTFVDACCFSMPSSLEGREYHPLALRVVGGYVRKYKDTWENIKIDFKKIGANQKKDPLFSILEIGWEELSVEHKNLYLDAVQFLTKSRSYTIFGDVVDLFSKWYCAVFDMEERDLHAMLKVLQTRAILEYSHDFRLGKMHLSVHDLYHEFASREANKSSHRPRCILYGRGEGGHYRRERLNIRQNKITSLTMKGLCECSAEVQILQVIRCDLLKEVDLRDMEDLLSIELLGCTQLEHVCLDDLRTLKWLHIHSDKPMIPSLKGLTSLQVLTLHVRPGDKDSRLPVYGLSDLLCDCTSLVELEISGYSKNLEFPDISNLKKLRSLVGDYLIKEDQSYAMRLRGFSNLVELRHLELQGVGLTDVDWLESLSKLKELCFSNCRFLKAIPSLAHMGLSLDSITIRECPDLEFVPSLENLSCLKYVDISSCKQVEEIHGIDRLQNLQHLDCSNTSIMYLPDLRMLTKLENLYVVDTPIPHIGILPESLRHFNMNNCPNLRPLPDLSHLTRLNQIDAKIRIMPVGTYQLETHEVLDLKVLEGHLSSSMFRDLQMSIFPRRAQQIPYEE